MVSVTKNPRKSKPVYIVRIVDKILDVVPSGIVSSDLDESATSLPGLGTTIGEAGESPLDVHERTLQNLVK